MELSDRVVQNQLESLAMTYYELASETISITENIGAIVKNHEEALKLIAKSRKSSKKGYVVALGAGVYLGYKLHESSDKIFFDKNYQKYRAQTTNATIIDEEN